jgi:hypothetical protein
MGDFDFGNADNAELRIFSHPCNPRDSRSISFSSF